MASLKIFHFDMLLLPKVYYVWPKKLQRSYVSKNENMCTENDAKFEEELSCALKNDMRNLANFVLTLESLKTCNLMSSFWAKYIIFDLKNYIGVMCHDTEGWCNI